MGTVYYNLSRTFVKNLGFDQVSYVDPSRKIASSFGSNNTDIKDIGVEMTAAGAADELGFVPEKKKDNNLLSDAMNMDIRSPNYEGYKILLAQAVYEMTRGSYSVAMEYLNRAIQVKKLISAIKTASQKLI